MDDPGQLSFLTDDRESVAARSADSLHKISQGGVGTNRKEVRFDQVAQVEAAEQYLIPVCNRKLEFVRQLLRFHGQGLKEVGHQDADRSDDHEGDHQSVSPCDLGDKEDRGERRRKNSTQNTRHTDQCEIGLGNITETEHVEDRKSTRLNSSHVKISYAVFCLKKKIH